MCRARGLKPPAPLAGACLQPPAPLQPRRGGRCFSWYCSGPLPRFLCCLGCGLRGSCSGLTPLRLSRGLTSSPRTPGAPTRGAVFFMVLFGAPPPFSLLFRVRPSAFFLALRGSWPLGCVWLCFVSIVRLSVDRGFFASLTGRFCGRASVVVGLVWLCRRLSIKSGSLSIILAYMQIFS